MAKKSAKAVAVDESKEPYSLAVVLFQLLRKMSYPINDSIMDNNKGVRRSLCKSVLGEAQKLMPDVTREQWSAGAAYLLDRHLGKN